MVRTTLSAFTTRHHATNGSTRLAGPASRVEYNSDNCANLRVDEYAFLGDYDGKLDVLGRASRVPESKGH